MFMNAELDVDKSEVDMWDIKIDKLIEYEYANDLWIADVIEIIRIRKWRYKDITLAECEIRNDRLYYR